MDFKFLETLFSCWAVKCITGLCLMCMTFLFGYIQMPFYALWTLVVIDLITKLLAIAKQTMLEEEWHDGIWYGLLLAFSMGKIQSQVMREKFGTKVIGYIFVLIMLNMLVLIMGSFGNYAYVIGTSLLAVTEAISILENLRDAGVTGLEPIAKLLCRQKEKISGDSQ